MASPVHCEILSLPISKGTVRVFVICLNTPDSSQNVINRNFALEFGKAVLQLKKLTANNEIDMVVICSGKENTFIAGADIKVELKYIGVHGSLRCYSDVAKLSFLFCVLETLPVPTLAIMNGTTLGAGFELALSCDFRVIDQEHGKQVGQPEVKIGVLPGAGGCFRLPYMIGLWKSLPILLTGQLYGAKKIFKLGLADALWTRTQSRLTDDSQIHSEETDFHSAIPDSNSRIYKYEWIEELQNCIELGRIGRKKISVRFTGSDTSSVYHKISLPNLDEEEMTKCIDLEWSDCDRKAEMKFPNRPSIKPTIFSPVIHFKNYVIYVVSALQLWRKVKGRMPAPYGILENTWVCYNTPSIQNAVAINSLGFSKLVQTTESKSLMCLFFLSRQLKKKALSYGSSNVPDIKANQTAIYVVVGKEGLRYSSAFVQSLLYCDLNVFVILKTDQLWNRLVQTVEKYFDYAVSRGHMTKEDVKKKVARLHLFNKNEEIKNGVEYHVVINMNLDEGDSVENIERSGQVINLSTHPHVTSGAVSIHLGDPLRKNTLSVEVMGEEKDGTSIQMASSMISVMGKIPVVTPHYSNVGWKLAHSHWSLAADIAMTGVKPDFIDHSLLEGGFTKGPFATLNQFDKDVLNSVDHLFINKRSSDFDNKAPFKPDPQDIIDLFIINLIMTTFELISSHPQLSADTIDFLCVSGLVQFPPTEGGPVNYLKRNGLQTLQNNLTRICTSTVYGNAFNEIAVLLIAKLNKLEPSVVNECGLSLLTDKELAVIGPAQGLEHPLSLLYPLPFKLQPLILFLVSLVFGGATYWGLSYLPLVTCLCGGQVGVGLLVTIATMFLFQR